MSLPRPSGLKAPSKIGKPTGLPLPKSASTPGPDRAKSAIAKSARAAGISATQADKYASSVLGKLPAPEVEPPPSPVDDFKIGDRVWVGGSKPGVIAFLGETQFAAGEWAGVVLDKPEGKNDGSVKGIRYFQCEVERGVFARITKLSRTPGIIPTVPKPDDGASESSSLRPNGMANRPTTPSATRSIGHFGSNTSLNRGSPATVSKPATKAPLKIGDRVLVSGSKMGTLRYIGETDFAKGEWAGVELDEKQGKNDGAVAGKRYFDCRPMYGLFAPVHKVARLTSGAGPARAPPPTTPTSTPSRSLMNTSLRLSKERSGSQESVSSISSSASSVSRSRVRLGVTSLNNQAKPGHRPSNLNITATTSALQKALKEKEEHIEQLLKERDLERSEVARAAAQVDEAEGQMSMMRMEQERYRMDVDDTVHKLRAMVSELQQEKQEIASQLDLEKRKVEDLQFQIEEEAMTKDDMETRTEEEEMRLREIERLHQREKERADKFEQELYAMKAMSKDNAEKLSATEEENVAYLDQIEEITHKLSQAENKIKSYESNRLEEGAKTSQVSIELEEKEHKVTELEDLLAAKQKETKQLNNNLQEVEEDLQLSREKNNNLHNQVEKLTSQLNNQSKASESFNTELQQLKSQISDLQRKLESSDEKAKHLGDEKIQLEQQMNDLMKNSGDSSKRLSILTDQLQDRNRKIQELQADLSSSTQQSAKLREEKDKLRKDVERERENITVKHNEIVNTIKLSLQDVQKELNKSNNKMTAMKDDFEKEKEEALNRKNSEINTLKKHLDQYKGDLEKQEVQTQAHKQVLEKLNIEMEALKFEKEKADKLVKRLEGEKDSINTDLIHIRVTNSKIQLENEKMVDEKNKLIQEIQDLKEDKDRVTDSKSTMQNEKDQLMTEKAELSEDRDKANRELVQNKASLQEKEIQIEELQKEVEKLKTDLFEKEETMLQKSLNQSQDMQSQVDKAQARIKELDGMLQSEISLGEKRVKEFEKKLLQQTSDSDQKYNQLEALFKEIEDERDTMKAQLEFSNLVAEERKRLEEQNMQLNQDMERAEDKKEIESLGKTNNKLQKEIANLKNENASLDSQRLSAEKQEKENKDLISQINSLKSQIQSQEVNSNTIGLTANQIEDKQGIDGQVDFLNSVIVDLQKKNSELKTRLEAMESGVVTNGEADSSVEESAESKKPPPRLFCDICDVFDKHDTEDCPCQAMDYEDDTPSPSHHHGDRKQLRPYCDICEEFHEPCENVAITVPLENAGSEETNRQEPRVRYRSGSDRVHIEDCESRSPTFWKALGEIAVQGVRNDLKHDTGEKGNFYGSENVDETCKYSTNDMMTNSQLGIYDDDEEETNDESKVEPKVNNGQLMPENIICEGDISNETLHSVIKAEADDATYDNSIVKKEIFKADTKPNDEGIIEEHGKGSVMAVQEELKTETKSVTETPADDSNDRDEQAREEVDLEELRHGGATLEIKEEHLGDGASTAKYYYTEQEDLGYGTSSMKSRETKEGTPEDDATVINPREIKEESPGDDKVVMEPRETKEEFLGDGTSVMKSMETQSGDSVDENELYFETDNENVIGNDVEGAQKIFGEVFSGDANKQTHDQNDANRDSCEIS